MCEERIERRWHLCNSTVGDSDPTVGLKRVAEVMFATAASSSRLYFDCEISVCGFCLSLLTGEVVK